MGELSSPKWVIKVGDLPPKRVRPCHRARLWIASLTLQQFFATIQPFEIRLQAVDCAGIGGSDCSQHSGPMAGRREAEAMALP